MYNRFFMVECQLVVQGIGGINLLLLVGNKLGPLLQVLYGTFGNFVLRL